MKNILIKISVVVILILSIIWAHLNINKTFSQTVNVPKVIPFSLDKWHGQNLNFDKSVYSRILPDELIVRQYKNQIGRKVYLAVVVSKDRSHIHDPEVCYKLQGFNFDSKKTMQLSNGKKIAYLTASANDGKYIFLYWYVYKNKVFNNRLVFFLNYFKDKLIGDSDNNLGLVVIYTDSKNYAELKNFVKFFNLYSLDDLNL